MSYEDDVRRDGPDSRDPKLQEEEKRRREEWKRQREERRREREAERAERRAAREERRARKERVLHTRVSDRLAEDIRTVADELRVPVSNLVRNVLEDAFSVMEVVSDNVGGLVEEVVDEADQAAERLARRARRYAEDYREAERRQRRASEAAARERREPAPDDFAERSTPDVPEFEDVLGWQPLVLNAERECAACSRRLVRGEQAFLGLTQSGPGSVVLCERCAP